LPFLVDPMPIEFRCSQCDQLLRVPETAAGKHARCPRCQALMAVPGSATTTATAIPVEGTADLSPPLPSVSPAPPPVSNPFAGDYHPQPRPGTWPGMAGQPNYPPGASAELNPYASPAATNDRTSSYYSVVPRSGLPWENEPHSIGSWFRTMSMVISSPTNAFLVMRQYGGLGKPLLFNAYAVGMLMALASICMVPLLALLAAFGLFDQNNGGAFALSAAIIVGLAIVGAIFYAVLLILVMPLVWSGMTHVSLMMVGGANHGFETTFRVICFGYFSVLLPSMLLNFVPYLGGFAAAIWTAVVLIYGISRAHETSGGRASAAVLLPMAVCCGIGVLIAILGNLNEFR
jgi:hypothetical protein